MNLAHLANLHSWKVEPEEARQIQTELAKKLKFTVMGQLPRQIAGVDLSYTKKDDQEYALAVIAVLSFPDFELIEKKFLTSKVVFPYVPGLLSFREAPPILKVWKRLNHEPEVVFFDGHGIAHPRGLGLASHMGLWINRPTIGVAKKKLYGDIPQLPQKQGDFEPILDPESQQSIGAVLQPKESFNPLFVSVGNLITLEDAIHLTQLCMLPRFRLPEPTRIAHSLSQKIKSERQIQDPVES